MTGQLPLVTVVVPTIGRPHYIADTLRSVLAQDYARLDILVSDNLPSVPTLSVLDAAGIDDARLRFVSRERRYGVSEHMNACVSEARGEYVMILSDDDQLMPGYVSEMVELMAAQPKVSVCLGRQLKISEQDSGLLAAEPSPEPAAIFDGVEFLMGQLSGRLQTGVLTHISLFARRDDILAVGGFKHYPDGSHADNFILIALALQGRVALGRQRMLYRVYLASCGLSTPFSALTMATRSYMHDFTTAVGSCKTLSRSDRTALLRHAKRSNTRLLLSRLRHVYRRRLAPLAFAVSVLQALQFAVTPVHRL